MDYVDLYQIHRWDNETPIEETLEALHDVVKAGKARYIGASSMYAWQFCKALYLADRHGWTRFVSMQNHYNLLYREEEREMMGLCEAEGIGVIPWSPLARGTSGPSLGGARRARSARKPTSSARRFTQDGRRPTDKVVVERVERLAEERGVSDGAGCAGLDAVQSPASPRRSSAQPSRTIWKMPSPRSRSTLTPEEIAALEEPYVPHPVLGFS